MLAYRNLRTVVVGEMLQQFAVHVDGFLPGSVRYPLKHRQRGVFDSEFHEEVGHAVMDAEEND